MEKEAVRLLLNCGKWSWTQGWVSATEAGLKATAVAVAVLGFSQLYSARDSADSIASELKPWSKQQEGCFRIAAGGAGPRAGSVLLKLGLKLLQLLLQFLVKSCI